MNNHQDQKIVGVFNTEREAVNAIDDLKAQGYRADEISIVAKDKNDVANIHEETGTKAPEGFATGAATGGVIGGLTGLLAGIGALAIPGIGPILAAGPIAATLTGAVVGAGTGGLVGGLVGLGFSEDDAESYNNYVNDGKILVMVDSDAERQTAVYDSFRSNRSLNASRYGTTSSSIPTDADRLNRR